MKKIEQMMSEIKAQLKESITSDSSIDEVNKISAIDQKLDSILEEVNKIQSEYDSLKDTYIEQVKNTGFKPSGSSDDDIGLGETKSLDDVLISELNKQVEKERI